MHLYDPHRPRSAGQQPQLLTNPGYVVPHLYIFPLETGDIRVSAMVPAAEEDGYISRQVSQTILPPHLPIIVGEYFADPEEFLTSFFHIDLTSTTTLRPKHARQPALPPSPNYAVSDDVPL